MLIDVILYQWTQVVILCFVFILPFGRRKPIYTLMIINIHATQNPLNRFQYTQNALARAIFAVFGCSNLDNILYLLQLSGSSLKVEKRIEYKSIFIVY